MSVQSLVKVGYTQEQITGIVKSYEAKLRSSTNSCFPPESLRAPNGQIVVVSKSRLGSGLRFRRVRSIGGRTLD